MHLQSLNVFYASKPSLLKNKLQSLSSIVGLFYIVITGTSQILETNGTREAIYIENWFWFL